MTRTEINPAIVADKSQQIRAMLEGVASLPLDSLEASLEDPRTLAAGESYLRRALEALLDLGRHLLAKGCGVAASEYKEIASKLGETGILPPRQTERFIQMAGYRNRLVHFYDEITPRELYGILTEHLSDVEDVLDRMVRWVRENPDR